MTPRLAGATYLRDYKIHVTFDDGREGVIDLEDELWGEVFEPLKDTDVFRCFASTPSWTRSCGPTGADLAPEFLYERAVVVPSPARATGGLRRGS